MPVTQKGGETHSGGSDTCLSGDYKPVGVREVQGARRYQWHENSMDKSLQMGGFPLMRQNMFQLEEEGKERNEQGGELLRVQRNVY